MKAFFAWATLGLGTVVALAAGCQSTSDEVTWHQHIAPLVTAKCQGCHSEGGIAPFSVETYTSARKWAVKMNTSIQDGTMPPWSANDTDECTHPAPFKDDLRLTEDEKALFQQWLDDGKLEGDPGSAASLPGPADLKLDNPSSALKISSVVEVSGTGDQFKCFTLDPGYTEDHWVTGVQVTPGNPAIVHHVLVFTDKNDEGAALAGEDGVYDCFGGPGTTAPNLLGAWAPGAVPAVTPEGMAMPLRVGTKLVIQVHYHPTGDGVETDDSTRVELRASTKTPEYAGGLFLIGNFPAELPDGMGLVPGPDDPPSGAAFLIPAGATAHTETQRFTVPGVPGFPLKLWAVGTHMHWAGTDMLITVEHDGHASCLVQTPNYDFNWQRAYFFEGEYRDLPQIAAGDVLEFRCTYDNSLDNPAVRDVLESVGETAPSSLLLGEQTTDEMCLGVFGAAVPIDYASALGL